MGTKDNPGEFDCYANAAPDEPMFVLLARDPVAPEVVEHWVKLRRQRNIDDTGDPKHAQAHQVANDMRAWSEERRRPLEPSYADLMTYDDLMGLIGTEVNGWTIESVDAVEGAVVATRGEVRSCLEGSARVLGRLLGVSR